MVQEQALQLIREVLEIDDLSLDSQWQEIGEIDSFALVDLLMAIQDRFAIQFRTAELRGVTRVADLIALVEEKVGTSTA